MKKILALALAVVFMFALAIPAFAFADGVTTNVDGSADAITDVPTKNQNVEVTYNVSGSYIVSVPAAITADSTTANEATVSASNVRIKVGQELTITVKSANDFNLKLGTDDEFEYTIKVDDSQTPLANNGEVLVVNVGGENAAASGAASDDATLKFTFSSNDAKYQGQYTDTLTFTVTVAAA